MALLITFAAIWLFVALGMIELGTFDDLETDFKPPKTIFPDPGPKTLCALWPFVVVTALVIIFIAGVASLFTRSGK